MANLLRRPRTEEELLEREQRLALAGLAITAQSMASGVSDALALAARTRRRPWLVVGCASVAGAAFGRVAIRPALRALRWLGPLAASWGAGRAANSHALSELLRSLPRASGKSG